MSRPDHSISGTPDSFGLQVGEATLGPQLINIFHQAPVAMCVLTGRDLVVTFANSGILEIWGKTSEMVLNKPLFIGLPEAAIQGFKSILEKVFTTGETFIANEMPIDVTTDGVTHHRFVKFIYQAIRDEKENVMGIMVIAEDITQSVTARKYKEANEIRNKLAIEAANMASFEWIFNDSQFIYSERLPQIFGLDPNTKFRQEHFIELIHPEDRDIRDKAIRKAMKTDTLFYEARIIWPDNSIHWIRLSGKVERHNEEAIKMYGMVLDITEQREHAALLKELVQRRTKSLERKNRELQASELRFQRMTEEVEDYAILLLDLDGTILNWNKGAEKIKGYREDEIVGKNITEFYLPRDRRNKLPEKLIRDASVKGRATHEGERIRKDGTVFWGSITITAIHDEDGEVIGFSKVTRDLTERKLAEDQLRQYTAELEFRNQELEQFAYIASHDLQEPLRKIRMFTGMLADNLDNRELVSKYYEKIESSAARMSDLIQSVLNYSRLDKTENKFETIDLNQIVSHVLSDFELLIEEKQAVILCDVLPVLRAIPLQMTQLFSNLIGNALKFCEKEPRITIGCSKADAEMLGSVSQLDVKKEYYRICIKDNGIGFEQKYAEQIFTIFQRLNSKSTYEGTGIGLALCKKIAENHRGNITASSEPGKGAEFCIFLPV
ncbi:PAS domain-containing sensor histidine kinase [Flavobacterium silvaticum]|uniref:histidine kinase n=1 Tax=Flavobacterium silvaticum TaxID=1852020 RepID=A0A972JIM3_9FLAO|nr:PAS domain S-box protein [Flavobacterium silvaticum]NMH27372.1 PAS domain S-box protein [Flavobacterium silvaticum]